MQETLTHLKRHHGDFDAFRDAMEESARTRFDAVFWGFFFAHVAPRITGKPRIVDVGTGPGNLLAELVDRIPDAELIGIECQPSMVKAAEARIATLRGRARLLNHDASRAPWPTLETASVHAVIASMVVHELPSPMPFFEEAARVLMPGGVLFLYDWTRHPLEQYSDPEQALDANAIEHFSEHCRYTPQDFTHLCTRAGLRTVEWMTRKNGRHALVAAERP